jgi:predicted Holliday junction resolvase-like endonuclease
MDITALILGAIIGLIIGILFMRMQYISGKQHLRKTAVQGSKNQILGEVYEKVLPALPNFPYAPKDMVFIGKGCDYIIFDGLTEGHLREILFLELKSGKAVLNTNERMIRDAVDRKKVRYTEYRIGSTKNMW